MGAIREQHAHNTEHCTCDERGRQAPRSDVRDAADRVMGVVNTPKGSGLVPDDGGHRTSQQCVVAQTPNGQDFQSEHGARQRGAKHRGKASGNTRHQQNAAVFLAQAKEPGELVGQCAAHLYSRAFAADGGSKEMGHHSAHQNQRRHAQGHHFLGVVDFVNEQVVASLH